MLLNELIFNSTFFLVCTKETRPWYIYIIFSSLLVINVLRKHFFQRKGNMIINFSLTAFSSCMYYFLLYSSYWCNGETLLPRETEKCSTLFSLDIYQNLVHSVPYSPNKMFLKKMIKYKKIYLNTNSHDYILNKMILNLKEIKWNLIKLS